MKWFGHIVRIGEDSYGRKAINVEAEGRHIGEDQERLGSKMICNHRIVLTTDSLN